MAIDSVSPVISRPPETTASARESAAQENDARRVAESARGAAPAVRAPEQGAGPSAETRVQVIATPDTEGSLREAASQIARASASADSSAALRSASEAYQGASSARQAMASQEQNNGATSVDVMA